MEEQIMMKPNNHMALAILTTICCCLPLGIVAIIFSVKAGRKADCGDYEGARKRASRRHSLLLLFVGAGERIY